jgi:hypothetical protein
MLSPRTILVSAVALAFAASAYAEEAPSFFPVMAWDHVPSDPAVVKRIRECGFTVAGFAAPAALDACHAEGLKAIVYDTRSAGYDWTAVEPAVAKKQVTELIAEVRNHPAVFGYYLRDEPTAGFFPGLAAVSSVIQEQHPGVWPYINLFPNYAHPSQLGAANYDAYLEKFVEVCKPTVLSYDHYGLLSGMELRPEYFANLESVRRAAQNHNLPFWNIVLACPHFDYREPTQADLRFQAFTTLAYGARGIAYFKYFTPAVGNFRDGPVDQFGNETPMWHKLQHVNLQIGKLAATLLQLKSDRVYHFGQVPTGSTGPDEQSLVKAIPGEMLVGDFTHSDGSRYVMIVNKDVSDSVYCTPQ